MTSGAPEEAVLDEAARILREIAALCREHRYALASHDEAALVSLGERAETLGARFKLLESARRGTPSASPRGPGFEAARRRLVDAATEAALAAESCADLLARSSAASAALRRVLDGFESAGYLPGGEMRPPARPTFLETKA